MSNTLEIPDSNRVVFDKLNQVKISNVFAQNTQNILFIGDRNTLASLEILKTEKYPKAYFHTIEFALDNSEASTQEIAQKQEFIIENIETVIIASIEHEKDIYNRIKEYINYAKILLLLDDIFINLVMEREALSQLPKTFTPPQTNYCILSTPRSGSTMLCEALASTKLAGFPREHLREPSLALAKHCNFDSDRYMRAIMSLHITPNSVFGTKLISHFIEKYINLSHGEFDPLSYFDKFIYLVRKDKVAQAVSLFMAQKSGVWHIDGTNKLSSYQDKINNKSISEADLKKVNQLYNRLLKEEKYLTQLCEQKNIQPIIVNYEDVVEDLSGNLEDILRYLNIISSLKSSELTISVKKKKLSSPISQKIIDLYNQKFPN